MHIRKAAVVGMDGRTSAIRRMLEASPRMSGPVPTLSSGKGGAAVIDEALDAAKRERPDFVVIGPEEPLAVGLVDELQKQLGIPCIGPTRTLARLESSKAFTRELVKRRGIDGGLEFAVFSSTDGLADYIRGLGDFVVKPDGLTGGKGVRVSGVHLHSVQEALEYCASLFDRPGAKVVIEEKVDGEEFSLQSFCDGTHVVDMVVVQDHKRAYEGDTGPNTGGMGSYSCADHLLPFIDRSMLDAASRINRAVARALHETTGEKYKGILFGGFMATRSGVKLLEYNARFGDPEALNVLSILDGDLCDIFEAIIEERLHEVPCRFRNLATVCKYVVPDRYPDPSPRAEIELAALMALESDELKVYPSAVAFEGGKHYATGSRTVACVGIGRTLEAAEQIAESAAGAVRGPFRHRRDIGTTELVARRTAHMEAVLGRRATRVPAC